MSNLSATIDSIRPVDRTLAPTVQAHLDDLTKPPGSLGMLEEIALRYCLIQGTSEPRIGGKRIVTFAADHGVVAEGVSAYPQEVTPQMVRNMLAGGAAINVLARHAGAEAVVVDMGVADPLDDAPGLVRRKIRSGTGNIAVGPAMTVAEATRALEIGVELAGDAADAGVTLIGTGEMGIGNTTSASALFAALLPCEVDDVVGRGTGIDDGRLTHKADVIRHALEVNRARLGDPVSTLAALGGLEIAGIAGLVVGAACRRVAVVVDGFISTAGAAVACRMCLAAHDYLLYSHRSDERGHGFVLDRLGATPILDLAMRLGEGTGAALAMPIIESSVAVYNEMATFSSAGVSGKTD